MQGLPDIILLPEAPKHWSFTPVHYSKSQVSPPGLLEQTFNIWKIMSPLQTKHTATSGVLKNKTSVHLSDKNSNRKLKI